jgi:hypothetical protein
LIPGDGIGKEISASVQKIFEAAKRGETGTETPAAPVVEPGAAPAPAAAPVQATKTEDELKAKLEEQRRDFERRSGEYGGNLQKLTQQIGDLSARLKELMDENARLRKDGGKAEEPPKEAGPAQGLAAYMAGLTPETIQSYGEELFGAVVTIARNVLKLHGNDAVDTIVKPIREDLKHVEASRSEEQWLNAIEALAPGFRKANGNVSAKIPPGDTGWIDFVTTQREPFTGDLWSDFLAVHNSPESVAQAYRLYCDKKPGKATTPGAARPSVESQVEAPSGSPTPVEQVDRAAKVYRMSDYTALRDRLLDPSCRDKVGIDEWNKLRAQLREYQQAASDGRLQA